MSKVKRKIIRIDDDKCTGCGLCVPNCPEGALQVIDGKARVINEFSCDGLGACIGDCPEDAISIEEKVADVYDEKKVMVNIVKAGESTIIAHLSHLDDHGEKEYLAQALEYLNENNISLPDYKKSSACTSGGCPGSKMIDRTADKTANATGPVSGPVPSRLSQWPVQLKLLTPHAPYFKDADLLIAADCVPFAYGDFHNRFLKDKIVVVFCPKLDEGIEGYIEKLTAILTDNQIRTITILRMEVPCCGGTTAILEESLKRSGKNIIIKEYVISLNGDIK